MQLLTNTYKRGSFRIEQPMPCCFIDPEQQWKQGEQKPCGKPGLNALAAGHDCIGRPHLFYYCDYHEDKRL